MSLKGAGKTRGARAAKEGASPRHRRHGLKQRAAQARRERRMENDVRLTKREVAQKIARTTQFMFGAAIVTVSMAWVEEGEEGISVLSENATAFGSTNQGKEFAQLPGLLPAQITVGYYSQAAGFFDQQLKALKESVDKAVAEQAANTNGGSGDPATMVVESLEAPDPAAPEEQR